MISDHTIPTPIAKIHSIPTSLISYHFSVPRQVASPSDYAARANSEGAKLSFAFMVFDSTPNFHTCRSYFRPIKDIPLNGLAVPPKRSSVVGWYIHGGPAWYCPTVQNDSTRYHQVNYIYIIPQVFKAVHHFFCINTTVKIIIFEGALQ